MKKMFEVLNIVLLNGANLKKLAIKHPLGKGFQCLFFFQMRDQFSFKCAIIKKKRRYDEEV